MVRGMFCGFEVGEFKVEGRTRWKSKPFNPLWDPEESPNGCHVGSIFQKQGKAGCSVVMAQKYLNPKP